MIEWVSECVTAPGCTFPSPRLWMTVNKVGIHRRWMSTVMSAPPSNMWIFHFFPPDLSYCDNLGPSRGRGLCFFVNHWEDVSGGGDDGGPKLFFLLESIFIKSVASRVNICSSLHALLSFRLGVQMCGCPTSHYETLRGNTFFLSVFH